MENNKKQELLDELVENLIELNDIAERVYTSSGKFNDMAKYYIILRDFKDKLNKYSSALNDVELTKDEIKIINEKINYIYYERPFRGGYDYFSDKFSFETLQIEFDKEYKDVNTNMGVHDNMVALLKEDPKSFSKLLKEHPNYACIHYPDNSENAKILKENMVFSEYMLFNDKIRDFEAENIKLKDLDDKIFANDVYYKQIEDIVNKKLNNLCKETLELITNDKEKDEILDAIQTQKTKVCDKMNEKRTKYFKSTLANAKQKIDEYCM